MRLEQKILPREIYLNAEPGVREPLQQVIDLLNPWLRDIASLTKNRLTFKDNTACIVADLDVTYPNSAFFPTVTLENSITEWGGGQKAFTLIKRDGWIDIGFFLKHNGTGGTNVVITTLPRTYWPRGGESYVAGSCNQQAATYTIDNGNGQVRLNSAVSSPANSPLAFTHRYVASNPDPIMPPGGFFPHYLDITKLGVRPSLIVPLQCTRVTPGNRQFIATPAPDIIWDYNSDGKKMSVKITDLPGLVPGYRYLLKLLVFA